MSNPSQPAKNNPDEEATLVDFAGTLIQKTSAVHLNITQELMFTTEDKVRLCLTSHLSRMEKRNAWVAPLGIFITILVAILTTTFKAFVFPPETWQAIFVISGVLSFGWFIKSVLQARLSTSMDSIVDELKKTSITSQSQNSPVGSNNTTVMVSTQSPQNKLDIESAKYGAGDKFNDVTALLASKVSSDGLLIQASNKNLDGDPCPQVPKQLIVKYGYRGGHHEVTVQENEVLSLPND